MKKIFVIIFVSVLIVFSALNILKSPKKFSETENRYLAQNPEFSFKNLFDGAYTKDFEKYVTDQVIFRDMFVSVKTNSEKLWGRFENNNVYFCDDEYLIDIPPKYNEEVLNKNINAINTLSKTGKYNVSLTLIPTAYEILKDKLPPYAYNEMQQKILSHTAEKLINVNFVNPTVSLMENKDEYLYYRTDHHQTMHGSFIVYKDILKSLGMDYYDESSFSVKMESDKFYGTTWSKAPINITPDEIITYSPLFDISYNVEYVDKGTSSDSLYVAENLGKKDKYTYYLGGNNSVVKISTSVKNGKKLGVIKDSYAHSIIPLLANHYEEIYVLDLRYYNFNPDEFLSENGVEDVIFIYNATNFISDTNLVKITAYLSK